MIFYYVVTAENKCAGKLETHIWGKTSRWRASSEVASGGVANITRDGRPQERKATSSRNGDNVEEEVKYGC
jgi:hypothetical protein